MLGSCRIHLGGDVAAGVNLQAPRSLTGPGVQEELADGAAQRVFAGETSYPDRRVGDGIAGGTVNDPTRNPERSFQPKIDDPRARNGVSGSGVGPGSPGEGTVPALQFVTGLGAGDVFSGGDLALFVGYGQGALASLLLRRRTPGAGAPSGPRTRNLMPGSGVRTNVARPDSVAPVSTPKPLAETATLASAVGMRKRATLRASVLAAARSKRG